MLSRWGTVSSHHHHKVPCGNNNCVPQLRLRSRDARSRRDAPLITVARAAADDDALEVEFVPEEVSTSDAEKYERIAAALVNKMVDMPDGEATHG